MHTYAKSCTPDQEILTKTGQFSHISDAYSVHLVDLPDSKFVLGTDEERGAE
jgi:hypothetical protein